MKLNELTAHEIKDLLEKNKVSSEEVTSEVLKQIEREDEKIGAFVTLSAEEALIQAREIDRKRKENQSMPPLAGIPIAVKDNICTKGIKTTCSSKMLENFVPPYNAAVAEKILASGMVIIGKTNMDEFAMGSSTETSFFGVTHNPWNVEMIPGGSSGGSAASIAGNETILSVGSDTGGSIRQPASMCGVVGLKPTYGRVSRFGLIAFASSLDQIGPITKDVTDSALLMNAISGYDPKDSTSVDEPVKDYKSNLTVDVKGLVAGIPEEYFVSGVDPEIESAVRKAIDLLEKLGIGIEKIPLPHTEYAVAVYYIIATAEACSNLARYDGVKYGYRYGGSSKPSLLEMYEKTRAEGFGEEVKRRIMLGTYTLSAGYYDAYYLKAQQVRTLIKQDFEKVFEKCDCIISPTTPTAAFRIGEKIDDPLQMYLSDIFTIPANLAGIPAVSIPCGFTGENLPIGLQIMGRAFDEETILRIAYAYEQSTNWHIK